MVLRCHHTWKALFCRQLCLEPRLSKQKLLHPALFEGGSTFILPIPIQTSTLFSAGVCRSECPARSLPSSCTPGRAGARKYRSQRGTLLAVQQPEIRIKWKGAWEVEWILRSYSMGSCMRHAPTRRRDVQLHRPMYQVQFMHNARSTQADAMELWFTVLQNADRSSRLHGNPM